MYLNGRFFDTGTRMIPDSSSCAGKSTQERLGDRLRAVEREITAVNAALDVFDQDAEAEDFGGEQEEDIQEQREPPPDVRLQRAGLEQRLADLQQKHRQLEATFAHELDDPSLQASGPVPKQILQLQEDDAFLDQELDNTRNSAMVETERDRLIRLVRATACKIALTKAVRTEKSLDPDLRYTHKPQFWERHHCQGIVVFCFRKKCEESRRHAQGLLTPFDRLEGFERRVQQPEAHGEASAPGNAKPLCILREPSGRQPSSYLSQAGM